MACGKKRPKDALLRIVYGKDGTLCPDAANRLSGRGAYLCKDVHCLELAKKRNAFSRAFRCAVDATQLDQIAAALKGTERV